MRDLIFVVRNDGTYEQVPNRNLRAQENYSDNFVVIANQVGVVKAKIKLLSRTDKVEVKYLVPSLENVYDLIGDKPYFQDYANANVWRGAVPKKLLQEVSMSYAGQVEVSFSFTKAVTDIRALEYKGEIYDDLPETASIGDYYIIRLSSYTLGDTTWTYGQQAIWEDGWIKGGTYKVIGTTTTHRLNVEQSLKGEQAEFDTENEDEYLDTLQDHSGRINTLENTANDHELRISTNEQDIDNLENEIDDIKDGEIVIGKTYGDEHGNRITTTYATQNTLDDVVNQIENTGEIVAKKAEYAEKDDKGRVIEETYLSDVMYTLVTPYEDGVELEFKIKRPDNSSDTNWFYIHSATNELAGVMTAADKARIDELWEVLQNSDDPTFIDTIRELLDIFENYPQGMDIIAQFATKVDKVAGKGLSTNDYTNEEKSKVANAASKAYVDEGDETIQAHDLDNATVERVMFVIENGQPILRIE